MGTKAELKKPAHVVAILRYPGFTAEDLREQLRVLSHHFQLGEVKDGSATLYFTSTMPEVTKLIKETTRIFPEDLVVEKIYEEAGEVPLPSVQVPITRTIVSIEREATQKFGLKIGDIARRISELRDTEQFDEFVEGKLEVSESTPEGRKVSSSITRSNAGN